MHEQQWGARAGQRWQGLLRREARCTRSRGVAVGVVVAPIPICIGPEAPASFDTPDTHGYGATEWEPVLCDIAASRLTSIRLDDDPPTVVAHAQDAISWLARTIAALDEDSREAPAALAETLAHLLAVWIFTDAALGHGEPA